MDDRLHTQNIMLALKIDLHDRVNILIIGKVATNNIRDFLTMIGHRVPLMSEDNTNSII